MMRATQGGWSNQNETLLFIVIGVILVFSLGVFDYLTGKEISFAIFYLLPVWLVASRAGLVAGCLIGTASAAMWMIADVQAGQHYSHPSILYWNGAVRLGFFLVVAVLLHVKRRTEAMLRQTQARFANLFTFAPDSIIVVDEQGRIAEANEQVTQLFGYSQQELLGVSAEQLLPARFRSARPDEPSHFAHPKVQQARISPELCGLRKDGSEFPLELVLSPMEVAGRRDVMVVLRNASGRKLLEGQLRQYSEGGQHTQCESQITRLKGEVNAILAELGRPKRYDVPSQSSQGG